jgi:hypothetical protein
LLVYNIMLTDVISTGGVTPGQESLSLPLFFDKFIIVSIKVR